MTDSFSMLINLYAAFSHWVKDVTCHIMILCEILLFFVSFHSQCNDCFYFSFVFWGSFFSMFPQNIQHGSQRSFHCFEKSFPLWYGNKVMDIQWRHVCGGGVRRVCDVGSRETCPNCGPFIFLIWSVKLEEFILVLNQKRSVSHCLSVLRVI